MPGTETSSLAGFTPFEPDRARRYRTQGWWQDLAFHEVLDRASVAHPNRVAVIGPEESYTYEELARRTKQLAASLQALGLEPHERIVFQLPNSPAFIEAFFACSRIGVNPVMPVLRHRATGGRPYRGTDRCSWLARGRRTPHLRIRLRGPSRRTA